MVTTQRWAAPILPGMQATGLWGYPIGTEVIGQPGGTRVTESAALPSETGGKKSPGSLFSWEGRSVCSDIPPTLFSFPSDAQKTPECF